MLIRVDYVVKNLTDFKPNTKSLGITANHKAPFLLIWND